MNSALVSRVQVYEFRKLGDDDVLALLRRALADERGLAGAGRSRTTRSSSWPRARAATRAPRSRRSSWRSRRVGDGTVTLAVAEDAMQRKAVLYDKGGDRHYDTISAWIKATRGSDPDASLLYLAIMLEGGEDARFIARRMVILASEDIGNADPRALQIAVAAAHAVEHVGLPECAHNLAQAAVYLSLAPKSNASYKALKAARAWVREHGAPLPPDHLRSAGYDLPRRYLGHGEGYDYPHDRPEGVSPQELMPPEAEGERFLELSEHGEERELRERFDAIRRARGHEHVTWVT